MYSNTTLVGMEEWTIYQYIFNHRCYGHFNVIRLDLKGMSTYHHKLVVILDKFRNKWSSARPMVKRRRPSPKRLSPLDEDPLSVKRSRM